MEMNTNSISARMNEVTIKNMDASLSLANVKSRSEYISKAVQFYNVYLQLNGEPDVFTKIVGNIVEAKMDFVISNAEEKRNNDIEKLSRNQFKIGVEIAKIAYILGNNLEIPKEKMEQWHKKAVEELSKINGIINFEKLLYDEG
jgi:hypothetical protein